MLFKLPTFPLTLALLSAQIQARGPPALTNVGNLISPSQGQTFKVGDVLPFEYNVDVQGPGPAYRIQLQHLDGSVISTFATGIVADNTTGIIAAQFLLVVLQRAPVEDTKYRYNYQLAQEVALTITA
ncbi:BZ3500_MvSof-1268-A1-R1_Chr7-1g09074 [Microbotryum saponariae]|uniref:BZ3500_MvSof-1268-A1-R1_Chr7-1g09074 protein n=1 Tax=Microbotryum saponariae TaxID=289078 RepID=A0A2X0L7M9_9BASI|nr:BZ3501_MvSof-1269-A2-R1_Chr7-1g08778 [Microbotryum saponariae]SDA02744.1 BZ3500_MvSof-1268-A1-R1_Chr7-1g09074 [Microbotryum saponariae]